MAQVAAASRTIAVSVDLPKRLASSPLKRICEGMAGLDN
jgi:hypothetical protein